MLSVLSVRLTAPLLLLLLIAAVQLRPCSGSLLLATFSGRVPLLLVRLLRLLRLPRMLRMWCAALQPRDRSLHNASLLQSLQLRPHLHVGGQGRTEQAGM